MAFASFVDNVLQPLALPLVEKNIVPDFAIRFGIRKLLESTLKEHVPLTAAGQVEATVRHVRDLKTRPIAECTADANAQHYEVPAAFYDTCLGPWKKYSCGYWEDGAKTLAESEEAALRITMTRAGIEPGMKVLDMGCGWGSFSLYCATRFPTVQVVGVSNSASQRDYIMAQAAARGLKNVRIVTSDINVFDLPGEEKASFDRVVSIEMMEHVKNYQALLAKVASWLKPGGKMFVHIFTHRLVPYHYTDGWMARTFFTGGQMPSADLLAYFQDDLKLVDRWTWNGKNYAKTCNAWLAEMDGHKAAAMKAIVATYGAHQATKWYVNWRLFFVACAELFDFHDGEEWFVSHYLFVKPQ